MDVPHLLFDSTFERNVRAGYLNHTLPRRTANGAISRRLRLLPANKYYRA
jgi:hypothetical protein